MSLSIEVSGLSKHYGAFKAVDDVSFVVERGEIFGYLGANGAGKSTTIRMLCGLLTPSRGRGRVAGYDIATHPNEVKANIGYMSQKFSLYLDLPVEENIQFFGSAYGLDGKILARRRDEILEATDLLTLRRERTSSLPGGVRQRLALGCALLHQPSIVFLDEPTAGVDPQARRLFWRLIRTLASNGTTVFVTTHYLDEAEYCARVGLMVDGKLAALDTPKQLKRTFIPEHMVRLRGAQVAEAQRRLVGLPGLSTQRFGAALHVRLSPAAWTIDRFESWLRAEQLASGVDLQTIEPTLEDVFLEVVKTKAQPEVVS